MTGPPTEILPGVAGMIAVALDRERLIAALRADREALRQSRSRLVEAEIASGAGSRVTWTTCSRLGSSCSQ